MEQPEQYIKLNPTPSDAISSLNFDPTGNLLVSACWDNYVRIYDMKRLSSAPNSSQLSTRYSHTEGVLDACFFDNRVYSGGLDKVLKNFDLTALKETRVGEHQNAIKSVHASTELGLIITGSWDNHVKLWDPRSDSAAIDFTLPDKVYTLDSVNEKMVVGTAGRYVRVFDVRQRTQLMERDGALKYQTRCIRCFPNGVGFAIASIEGRVAIEYFDANDNKKKYAFKCHRSKDDKVELIYPVHALAFHCGYNTFATGGADGQVCIWDGVNKKRLAQLKQFPASVLALAMYTERGANPSAAGPLLAIGVGDMFEGTDVSKPGALDHLPPSAYEGQIFVRRLPETEVRPKTAAQPAY